MLGALVTCNNYFNPNLLADITAQATTSPMANGSSTSTPNWFEKNYNTYRFKSGSASGRLDNLTAALPHSESRIGKLTPPRTHRIPVLIAGGVRKKTLRLIAKRSSMWHFFSDMLRHRNGMLYKVQ